MSPSTDHALMTGRRAVCAVVLAAAIAAPAAVPAAGAARDVRPMSATAHHHPGHGKLHGSLPLLHAVPDPAGGRIVDARDRQVLLRGIALNSLGDYGLANAIPPTYPFHAHDATVMRRMGFNIVRLVLNWSKIEPAPGKYDAHYLRRAAHIVHVLGRAGIYSLVDMHQDAWSPVLATRPGESCPPPTTSTLGFDGAPAWATLGRNLPHCQIAQQEGSLAVFASWQAFLSDAAGPGGVGIQTRFVRMWRHVAARFARSTDVIGFDVLNEPLLLGPLDEARAAALYSRTLDAIRAGERSRRGVRHIVMVEPSILFSQTGLDTPVPFAHDSDVAYAPHIYTGTFPTTGPPSDSWFTSAHRIATLLGGIPVVDGEWGGRPRSRNPIDATFYNAYQAMLDRHGFGGIFWVYRSTCGDPFEITQHATETGGLYRIICRTNHLVGLRHKLVRLLARPYPRAVTGRITSFTYSPVHHRFRLVYRPTRDARGASAVEVPRWQFHDGYRVTVRGARVVSRADARVLRLRDRHGSKQVRVTVTR